MYGVAIGIDTGGTYTDGVILNLETQEVVNKAKARTTREDLTIGISECINNLSLPNPNDVGLVALSTTLATNAIVEGKGCEVGVILIGHDPIKELPVKNYVSVSGGHNIKGKPVQKLDIEATKKALKNFEGKVDAIAISGFLSIRNPEHELKVKELVHEILGLPVVCAHQLTTSLGFHERTVTAALNARLIPIITELIQSVKQVLLQKGINAPIMIVKGDGSLMGEEVAVEKPIETILSGPAASIVGATFLTTIEDAIVLDMGGTTTDIAMLKKGIPKVNSEGASVGGWLTRVEAAEVYTYGVGGDSYLQIDPKDKKLVIGPRRVWPLCYVISKYPYLKQELFQAKKIILDLLNNQKSDCFIYLKEPNGNGSQLSSKEREILDLLKDGPHSILYLSKKIGTDPNFLPVERLENLGAIARISVTPTDILHVAKDYNLWSKEGASLGVQLLADQMGMSEKEFAKMAMDEIVNKIALAILQSLVNIEGKNCRIEKDYGCNIFLDKVLGRGKRHTFNCSVELPNPIVAIGAPVQAYLPKVAEKLNAHLIIPSNSEVANAVGAATGKVVQTAQVLIKPGSEGGFIVHLPWERKSFMELEEATKFAMESSREWVRKSALRAGASDPNVMVEKEDVYSKTATSWSDEVYVETRITATAVGKPKWSYDMPGKTNKVFVLD